MIVCRMESRSSDDVAPWPRREKSSAPGYGGSIVCRPQACKSRYSSDWIGWCCKNYIRHFRARAMNVGNQNPKANRNSQRERGGKERVRTVAPAARRAPTRSPLACRSREPRRLCQSGSQTRTSRGSTRLPPATQPLIISHNKGMRLAGLVFLALTLPLAAQQPDPTFDSCRRRRFGSLLRRFTITDTAGKPLYAAKIQVRVAYGRFHKLDLEVGTNIDGKARFAGLPSSVRSGLFFEASEGDRTGNAFDDPSKTCIPISLSPFASRCNSFQLAISHIAKPRQDLAGRMRPPKRTAACSKGMKNLANRESATGRIQFGRKQVFCIFFFVGTVPDRQTYPKIVACLSFVSRGQSHRDAVGKAYTLGA